MHIHPLSFFKKECSTLFCLNRSSSILLWLTPDDLANHKETSGQGRVNYKLYLLAPILLLMMEKLLCNL